MGLTGPPGVQGRACLSSGRDLGSVREPAGLVVPFPLLALRTGAGWQEDTCWARADVLLSGLDRNLGPVWPLASLLLPLPPPVVLKINTQEALTSAGDTGMPQSYVKWPGHRGSQELDYRRVSSNDGRVPAPRPSLPGSPSLLAHPSLPMKDFLAVSRRCDLVL